MSTVVITGGTGLIGRALARALIARDDRVIILSRNPALQKASVAGIHYAHWDPAKGEIDREAIGHADFILHLAGAGVGEKRWTKKRKQEIVSSRVTGSRLIAESLQTIPNKVKAVVSISAIGWYGPDPSPRGTEGENHGFKESDPPANDFLGETCRQWEQSIDQVSQTGIRLVKLRAGLVLSKEGGALKEFIKPLVFGIATIIGRGRQVVSWIHLDDLVNIFLWAMDDEAIHGVYNAVAPSPVSNKELVMELGRVRQKFFIPVHIPAFLLKLFLGEMSIEVLKSARVSCERLVAAGYQFHYPGIRSALVKCIRGPH